jgi:hypothetical protein
VEGEKIDTSRRREATRGERERERDNWKRKVGENT